MTDYSSLRTAMVDHQIRPSDVTKYPVIEAMLAIRREVFVPDGLKAVAYTGEHLDLGRGRFLLDPRIFAKMLDVLDVGPQDLVLDLGCGLGYSSAVIARMAEAVVAVEEDETLVRDAEEALAVESVDNAVVMQAPLSAGAPQHGPYDALILEGSVEIVPDTLLAQLKDGGRLVAIFAGKGAGHCRFGVKTEAGVSWRTVFDCTAPALPGFARELDFVL